MNQKSLVALILPAILVPLAVILTVNTISGGGNQLGKTFLMLSVIVGSMTFFIPRAGMLLFFVLQFYTDFFKRLLILGDSLSQNDVMTTLGFGPVIVIMACFSCAISCLTGKVEFFNKRDLLFFVGCVGVSSLGLAIGGLFSSARDVATIGQSVLGTAMIGMTAYATYTLFRTKDDFRTMFRWILLGAIPMGIYALHQAFFGVSQWEEAYIKTGLSPILYNFYHTFGIDEIRPFSTLNLHTSLGAVSGILFLISALIMTRGQQYFGGRKSHISVSIFLSILYLIACFVSRNRTTYFLPLIGFIMPWIFANGLRILGFYVSTIMAFLWIVINSEFLHQNILKWSYEIGGSALGEKFGTLGTFQDRLKGFMALSDPQYWTPFGLKEESRPFVHDQITEILIKLGYVPLTIIALVLCLCLVWWHRKCLSSNSIEARKFLSTLTGIIITLGICGIAYGNLLFVAPVNSLLGAMIGAGMGMILLSRDSLSFPVSNSSLEHVDRTKKFSGSYAASQRKLSVE
jgi:hypothetical protein